jgi:hypothetical protein
MSRCSKKRQEENDEGMPTASHGNPAKPENKSDIHT